MDINFKAIEMFQVMETEFTELKRVHGGNLVPQVHGQITELKEFIETFLYYFS